MIQHPHNDRLIAIYEIKLRRRAHINKLLLRVIMYSHVHISEWRLCESIVAYILHT